MEKHALSAILVAWLGSPAVFTASLWRLEEINEKVHSKNVLYRNPCGVFVLCHLYGFDAATSKLAALEIGKAHVNKSAVSPRHDGHSQSKEQDHSNACFLYELLIHCSTFTYPLSKHSNPHPNPDSAHRAASALQPASPR